jgi:hypothetical protein
MTVSADKLMLRADSRCRQVGDQRAVLSFGMGPKRRSLILAYPLAEKVAAADIKARLKKSFSG